MQNNSLGWSRRSVLAAGTAALALRPGVASAATTQLKFLIPWTSESQGSYEAGETIVKTLAEVSQGRIVAQLYDSTVVPSFRQLQPVSSGAFDLHFTSAGYHTDTTSIGSLGDTVVPNPEKRRGSGLFDMVDEHYRKTQNLKVLGWAGTPGYQFLLKQPVGADGGLKGLKIRGNPAYAPIIEALGGAMVTLAQNEIYAALQKGLIDGTAWPRHSMISFHMDEVVKYIARPAFATSSQLLLMNLDKFEGLAAEDQQAMLELGRRFEVFAREIPARIAAEDEPAMIARGVQYTNFSEDYSNNINRLFNEGVWKRTTAQDGAPAEAIIAAIQQKGLAQDER